MVYIQSSAIKAYPVVNRNTTVSGDTYSRHTSEEALTGIVNKLINTDGFVITQKDDIFNEGTDTPFAFNIHGYYFTIDSLTTLLSTVIVDYIASKSGDDYIESPEKVIYAGINLLEYNKWVELAGQDESSESGNEGQPDSSTYTYKSVIFSTNLEEMTQNCQYYIPLCVFVGKGSSKSWNNGTKKSGIWIPNNYYLKYFGSSFEVDGGDLDTI